MSHLYRVRVKESSPFTSNQSQILKEDWPYLGLGKEHGGLVAFPPWQEKDELEYWEAGTDTEELSHVHLQCNIFPGVIYPLWV